MPIETIAILSPGAMGHAVGAALTGRDFRVVTALADRGELSRRRAERAGIEDLGSLEAALAAADLVLSVLPPEAALGLACSVAEVMAQTAKPVFADCNAISPETTLAIAKTIEGAGATFINAGIIGPPPGSSRATKFYVSGAAAGQLQILEGGDIRVLQMGDEITKASAIKMCYAGLTKGMMTLHTAVLIAAERLGIGAELHAEFEASQQFHWQAMNARVPWYACDAGRWAGEMDQIAETLGAAGVTANLHKGAADIFRLLDASPLGGETRETLDESRTLDEALKVFAATAAKLR